MCRQVIELVPKEPSMAICHLLAQLGLARDKSTYGSTIDRMMETRMIISK